ncbi:MAG: fibrinogen-like YCDxxxxGGGW domain-containing protein [Bradymonadaceae bacterium]
MELRVTFAISLSVSALAIGCADETARPVGGTGPSGDVRRDATASDGGERPDGADGDSSRDASLDVGDSRTRDTARDGTDAGARDVSDVDRADGAGTGCAMEDDCDGGTCVDGACVSPSCSDGVRNQDETDIDCGGEHCAPCPTGKQCSRDRDCQSGVCVGGTCRVCRNGRERTTGKACGYRDRGEVRQRCERHAWVDAGCQGVWFASCSELSKARPNASTGTYTIDPDGPSSGKIPAFKTTCDMQTDGGGWTEITPCIARKKLGAMLVGVHRAPTATVDSKCRPYTSDKKRHTYHYTFEFPPGFREFFLDGFESKGNHGDVDGGQINGNRFEQTSWSKAWKQTGRNGGIGDISFGSAAFGGPETSYGRESNGKTKCRYCTFSWPAGNKRYEFSRSVKTFRIGWGERGPDPEGWYPWWSGSIWIR